ncbi:MAG: TIGR02281 family clan AA aspartic protease [Deltaproteobacteria bacterium]|nr:TIGR02281 family clan AA aspartic protease [Deltaproteobacteria bacterium]
MRFRAHIATAALAASFATLASAEIYRWVDGEGRVHFTQNLSQVPAHARAEAERTARSESPRRTPAATVASAPGEFAASRTRGFRSGAQIKFEKQGNAMLVYVRINDAVTAPFLVDTGASDVVVPAHVADAAGIHVTSDTPREVYTTANGTIESPVVTLSSVEVGDVRVENVRGSLSDLMNVGLLGGSFFNNFTFQINPGESVITLFPNEHVRAGGNAEEWRERFGGLRRDLAALDRHLSNGVLLDQVRAADLARRRAEIAAELEALEDEANRAGVPAAWRE